MLIKYRKNSFVNRHMPEVRIASDTQQILFAVPQKLRTELLMAQRSWTVTQLKLFDNLIKKLRLQE